MANFRDTYTWRYPLLSSMRTVSYKSGLHHGRSRCSRTIWHRAYTTSNCANPVASMKVLELLLVLLDRIMRSVVLLFATWGRRVGLGASSYGMIGVEEVERWISV